MTTRSDIFNAQSYPALELAGSATRKKGLMSPYPSNAPATTMALLRYAPATSLAQIQVAQCNAELL